jgi:putative endonuclease
MLKSLKNGKYYVGISENIIRRLKEHNSGKLETTSKNKPFVVVFQKEYLDYKEARRHEIWLKKKDLKYKDKVCLGSLYNRNLNV